MSRIAYAHLNVPLSQLENFNGVRTVFSRNTRAVIDNALRFVEPTPTVLYLADLLRLAADELVEANGDATQFATAKADFIAITKELQGALLKDISRSVVAKTEVAGLAMLPA